ncbi:hypothetical protein BV882_33330 [Streptomyces sp. 46]|nr:hypothetical protein BV882_33330 [Streptomyces sp. 46]
MVEEPVRYRVEFATGTAASVAKRRSYRDLERNDIEQDLPDWPTRPAFEVRGFFGKLGVHVLTATTARTGWYASCRTRTPRGAAGASHGAVV